MLSGETKFKEIKDYVERMLPIWIEQHANEVEIGSSKAVIDYCKGHKEAYENMLEEITRLDEWRNK